MKALSFGHKLLIGGLAVATMAFQPALTGTAQAKHDGHDNGKHLGWSKGKHKGWSNDRGDRDDDRRWSNTRNTAWRTPTRTTWRRVPTRTTWRSNTWRQSKPFTPSVNAGLRLRDTDRYRTLAQARAATADSRRSGFYTTSHWDPNTKRYVVRQYVRR